MAAQYGYPAIECDVKYTADSVMVLMHDETINRTMRNASDYSAIEEPVLVCDCTYEELRAGFVLASTDPDLRIPIPTLEEQLLACKECGIIPMLHSSVVESYKLASEILGDGFIAFHAFQPALAQARNYSQNCLILLDPDRDEASRTVERLIELGGPCGMSTMKYEMLDSSYISTVKEAGFEVQASIFPTPEEQRALSDGVTIELSDFYWYQTAGKKPIATFDKRNLKLSEDEMIDWSREAPEYAAITVDLSFTGALEVTLCGRTYTFNHSDSGKVERIGIRLYKTEPTLSVKALGTTNIKRINAALYDCGK